MIITNKNKVVLNKKYIVNNFSLDDMTIAYVSGMTSKPNTAHIKLIDTFIKQTKTILQNKADVVYLGNINNSNDSFRNLVKNAHHGTIQGTGLVYDSYWGFSNPNGTGYVNTNYNPSTQGVKYTLNDAGAAVYTTNRYTNSRGTLLSAIDGSINYIQLYQYDDQTTYLGAINQTTNAPSFTIPFRDGLQNINRTSATSINFKNQNVVTTTSTQNSTSKPNTNVRLFCMSTLVAGRYYYDSISFTYIGASLTDSEFITLNDAVNDYLIQCLFLKYGDDNFGVKMAKSYFLDLHNFEKYEAFEVYEFLKRHQSDYTYIPSELSVNSGAVGMTDWVDSNADGLADSWVNPNAASLPNIYSIVTGNGFTGNAQRALENNTSNVCWIQLPTYFVVGRTYIITGKYRSSNTFALYRTSGGAVNGASYIFNTGNAVQFTFIYTSDFSTLYFRSGTADADAWLEIDEVSIKEITESDVVTFNKCLNSGFGLGSDWINPTNGLAQYWSKQSNNQASIVTGNGFSGNAQRLERITNSGVLSLYQAAGVSDLIIGKLYTFYIKYRSNIAISLYNYLGTKYGNIGTNTGNAIAVSFQFIASHSQFLLGTTSSVSIGSYLEVDELLIIDSSNSQFLYNVFGSNGLNKTVCDYLMLFKAGGNLVANAWTKTGATLRWNQDGTVTSSNTMPAYTRGSNLGIVTVSSTDGWNGMSIMVFAQSYGSLNSFYGNLPKLSRLITNGKVLITGYYNKIKIDFADINFKNWCSGFYLAALLYPGGFRFNINNSIGGSYSNYYYNLLNSAYDSVTGNISLLTNEITSQLSLTGGNIIGNPINILLPDTLTQLVIQNVLITQRVPRYNKNLAQYNMANCSFSTTEVDATLAMINAYFASNTPIKNVIINLSGASMGIPTGGANNTDLLGIIAKHTAAGYTATITVRTS